MPTKEAPRQRRVASLTAARVEGIVLDGPMRSDRELDVTSGNIECASAFRSAIDQSIVIAYVVTYSVAYVSRTCPTDDHAYAISCKWIATRSRPRVFSRCAIAALALNRM